MLETIAWISLGLALVCALVIAIDERRHPQKMGVMNVVWPVTALYLSVFALWWYFAKGRRMACSSTDCSAGGMGSSKEEAGAKAPTWDQTALAASHCGAGCALADIVTESAVYAAGATLFGIELYASYLYDFAAAWLLGVVFQYFTIKPMRDLSFSEGYGLR